MLTDIEIPYGGYWSTPFCKWQGALQHLHAIKFSSHIASKELEKRNIPASVFDFAVLGTTIPQHQGFYGTPWMSSMIGLDKITGPTIAQACATGVRSIFTAATEIKHDMATTALVVTADRCSNGPHLYYPAPGAPGGTGLHEDWVLDNFSNDPAGGNSMLDTAENVARKHGIPTEVQHELVLRRFEQYQHALANDAEFQRRYMQLPFEVPGGKFDRTVRTITGDEGIAETTAQGLAKLRPVLEGGTVTYGGQTHPADGNASIIVSKSDLANQLSADPNIRIRLIGFGQARVEQAYMPEATVPASKQALSMAGLAIDQIDCVKSHNPFAVNDIIFAKETGVDVNIMNNFGCSLIWGHPQAPTGTRSVIELIEELAQRGGGHGLFQGCAAGDSAMALVVSVDVK